MNIKRGFRKILERILFNRKFVLSEDMVVQGAALSNGILYIGIQRVVPEHKKPKKIPLTSKESLLNS